MKIETTKMSSRGQVVIPQDARNELEAKEGTIFLVMTSGDTIILKKVEMPSKKDLLKQIEKIAKEGSKKAEKLGIKESDSADLVHRLRRLK